MRIRSWMNSWIHQCGVCVPPEKQVKFPYHLNHCELEFSVTCSQNRLFHISRQLFSILSPSAFRTLLARLFFSGDPLLHLTNFCSAFTIQIDALFYVKSLALWEKLVMATVLQYFSYCNLYHIALYLWTNLSGSPPSWSVSYAFLYFYVSTYLVRSRFSGKFC